MEDFREFAPGKLSAVKICMDLNAVTGGACESLHDQPVGYDVCGQVDFMFGAINKGTSTCSRFSVGANEQPARDRTRTAPARRTTGLWLRIRATGLT